jgi:hypothetical protein
VAAAAGASETWGNGRGSAAGWATHVAATKANAVANAGSNRRKVLVMITRMAMGGAGTGGTGESRGEIADWHQRPQAEKHAIQP